MSRPEAAFMWPSAAAWVSGLRLALFGHRPLAEHTRAGVRGDSARVSALGDAGELNWNRTVPTNVGTTRHISSRDHVGRFWAIVRRSGHTRRWRCGGEGRIRTHARTMRATRQPRRTRNSDGCGPRKSIPPNQTLVRMCLNVLSPAGFEPAPAHVLSVMY